MKQYPINANFSNILTISHVFGIVANLVHTSSSLLNEFFASLLYKWGFANANIKIESSKILWKSTNDSDENAVWNPQNGPYSSIIANLVWTFSILCTKFRDRLIK